MGASNPFREAPMTDLNALESLYFAALEKPAAQRPAFLDGACGGDADLRAQRSDCSPPGRMSGGASMPRGNGRPAFGRADGDVRHPFPAPTADFPGKDEHVGAVRRRQVQAG